MNATQSVHQVVIAIDPYHKGFGFMIMNGPRCPVDWGLKQSQSDRLNSLRALLDQYRPDVLVLPEPHKRFSNNPVTQKLLNDLIPVCEGLGIKIYHVSHKQVKAAFDARNKYMVATAIASLFPELAVRLPKPRKIYQSEDDRMNIFDATALAMTYYLNIKSEEKEE